MQEVLFLCRGVSSVATQGRAFPPKHFCITHPELELLPAPSLANARSYGLACSPYGHVPLSSSGWLACAYGLLLVVVASRHPTNTSKLQMTKGAFGGSRVIHGQNCPISDEISQKLDLYSDRPKSGRLCRQASQSSTHGVRPRQSSSNTSRWKCSRVCTPADTNTLLCGHAQLGRKNAYALTRGGHSSHGG